MYHLELRKFPHNFNRFNLDRADLDALLDEWVQGRPVEIGDRKWSPHTARLTILEGPELPVEELSMGRGWPAAERRSADVTDRALAEASQRWQLPAVSPQPAAPQPPAQPDAGAGAAGVADPLAVGVQIAALLGPDAARLLDAWRAAAASSRELSPSEALALAERTLAAEQPG